MLDGTCPGAYADPACAKTMDANAASPRTETEFSEMFLILGIFCFFLIQATANLF